MKQYDNKWQDCHNLKRRQMPAVHSKLVTEITEECAETEAVGIKRDIDHRLEIIRANKRGRPSAIVDIVLPDAIDPLLDTFDLTKSDSYKGSHGMMLAKIHTHNPIIGSQYYVSARKGSKFPAVLFFGLQYFIEMLQNTVITEAHVESVASLFKQGLGDFDPEPWFYVAKNLHGALPLTIRALPEGVEVPAGVPLFTIEATDPRFATSVGYLETFFSQNWYTLTVATLSHEVKKVIFEYLLKTSTADPMSAILFMLHDFGVRGASSMTTASIGGAAHAVSFFGSDNLPAVDFIQKYYGTSVQPIVSVNASEHSVMTSKLEEGELEVIRSLLENFQEGVLSIVIDSYDQYRLVKKLTTELLSLVMARHGKLVLRPDSGVPSEVLARLLSILSKNLEQYITINDKGYKVLPNFIGIIYGDGLDLSKIRDLLEVAKVHNFSADNLVFGMGGGLLQKVDRDTCRFAWKCCAVQLEDGEWRDVYKDPVDGKGTNESKTSLKGRQKVVKIDGVYQVVREDSVEHKDLKNELETVFENGFVKKYVTFDEIRARASAYFVNA